MTNKTIDTTVDTPKAKAKSSAKASKSPAKAAAKAKAATHAAAKAEAAGKAVQAKADTLAIHVNKTGRVCFGAAAAARLGDAPYCTLTIDGKLVRLEPAKKDGNGALPVRDASGRPYISATRQFKPLGFDGSRPYDIEAKPFGSAGFEFRLQ